MNGKRAMLKGTSEALEAVGVAVIIRWERQCACA